MPPVEGIYFTNDNEKNADASANENIIVSTTMATWIKPIDDDFSLDISNNTTTNGTTVIQAG